MQQRKMVSLKINAILNSTLSIMSIIFPLITYPYATRILQPENLGKVNFASATVSYFSLIAVLGISSYASREGVQYRSNRKKLNQFCSELFTLNIITSAIALLLLLICWGIVYKLRDYTALLIIYASTIVFGIIGLNWLYTLEEDYLYITIRSLIFQIISILLLFLLVKDETDFYRYAALNAFANVGSNIFNAFYCKRYIDLRICYDLKKVFQHIKSCLIFFSSSLASSIYSNIDTTMLGLLCTDYNVGIYSAAVKIYVMLKTLLTSITSVSMPRLTYYITHNMDDSYQNLVSQIFKIMITLLFPVVVGLNIVSNELVVLLLGDSYEKSEVVLKILAVAIFFSIFAIIFNGCILLPNKMEKMVLKSTIAGAVVNLLTNFIAIPYLEQNGAAITTVISEFVVMIVGWKYAQKLIGLKNLRRTIVTSIIGCIGIILIGYGCNMILQNLIVCLIVKITICSLSYFLILYLLKNEVVVSNTKSIIENITKRLNA